MSLPAYTYEEISEVKGDWIDKSGDVVTFVTPKHFRPVMNETKIQFRRQSETCADR